MTGIVAHTYPEWWLKLTGQAAHWSTDYSQAVAGIRDNDIRKNGVCMLTAVTENPHHTKVGLFSLTCLEVNDGAAIVVVDVTVTSASTDGTGLKVGLKHSHIGIKKRF